MTSESLFLIGFVVFVLVLLAIDCTRKVLIEYQTEVLGIASAYVFLLADIKGDDDTSIVAFNQTWKDLNTYLVVIGLLLAFLGVFLSFKQKAKQKTNRELELELQKMSTSLKKAKDEHYDLCNDYIKELFSVFFANSIGNGRVSLYRHKESSFVLIGRYSNNPQFSKRGQEVYPDDEGFMSLGWQQGTYECNNIPEWEGKLGTRYREFMKQKSNVTDERLKKLTMRSRSFYIYRFNNSNAQKPHGLIVFEQLTPNPIQAEIINQVFHDHEAQLVRLLRSMSVLHLD